MFVGNNDNVGEEELSNTFIYPHSVTISAEGVYAKEVYNEHFGESKFLIYLSIYSRNPNTNYVIELAIVDLNDIADSSHKMFICETLDSEEYKTFINSMFIIFKPFKRNVLNYEKGTRLSIKEHQDNILTWIEEGKTKLK